MHEGRTLHNLVKIDDRNANEIAGKLGITRQHLYKIYKLPKLAPYYVEKLRQIGITLPEQNASNVSNLLRGVGGTNGSGNHIRKNDISTRNSPPPNSISVASIISLSLDELLKLQRDQDDPELLKTVNLVIQLKKDLKALENENKLLKENIQDLRKK